MRTRTNWIAVAGAWLGLVAGTGAQNANVPELEALRNYVGEWDAAFTVQSGSDGSDKQEMGAEVKAKWILGGRFVRQTGKLTGGEGDESFVIETIMTYDTSSRTYRSWSFTSAGTAMEATGTWDAQARAMTWKGEEPGSGNTTVTTATFKGEGEEHWQIATADASGKALSLIAGVNRRK